MARIRTIKPEFFTDEKLAFCTVYARFLFIGLWVFADDDGRMEYSPKRIAMQIFPGEATDALPLLAELIKHLLVRIYEVEGKSYLCIPGFDKHQKMRRKLPSRYPSPNDRVTDLVTDVPPMPEIVRTADAIFRPVVEVEVVPEVVPDKRKNVRAHFSIPSLGEIKAYCEDRKSIVDPQQWFNYYSANGWKVGRNPMKDWRASVRYWETNGFTTSRVPAQTNKSAPMKTAAEEALEDRREREEKRARLKQPGSEPHDAAVSATAGRA